MNIEPTQLRPFIPSGKDFHYSKNFSMALGFHINWEGDGIAELQWGAAVFLLQDFENEELQQNLMMYLSVNDLDEFWQQLQNSGVLNQFDDVRAREPTEFPWGIREVHLIDPAGVCWHIA
ncbi:MAG: hypothetical protein HC808_12915 [Candidatus Competibacteraceae bacterium]|nr:hypothetical protein [Candidatus Competibacteraceae bacterium]